MSIGTSSATMLAELWKSKKTLGKDRLLVTLQFSSQTHKGKLNET